MKYDNEVHGNIDVVMTREDGTIMVELKKSLFPYNGNLHEYLKGYYVRNSKGTWYRLIPDNGKMYKVLWPIKFNEVIEERRRLP